MLDFLAKYLESLAPHIGPHTPRPPCSPTNSEASVCEWDPQEAYRSTWFLSPRQHVVELLLGVLVLLPSLVLLIVRCLAELRKHGPTDKTFRPIQPLQKVWAICLLSSVAAVTSFKLGSSNLGDHPAFLWQPCHGHSVILGGLSLIDTSWARAVFHAAVTLWWGPLLALVSPDLPTTSSQVFFFYFQHVLMVLAVPFRARMGSNWLYRSGAWNFVGWLGLLCYHYWVILPVGIATGINVATMMSPPQAIEHWGSAYRVLWTACCFGLHAFATAIVFVLGTRADAPAAGDSIKAAGAAPAAAKSGNGAANRQKLH